MSTKIYKKIKASKDPKFKHSQLDDNGTKKTRFIVFTGEDYEGLDEPYCWVSSVQNAPWEIFNTKDFSVWDWPVKRSTAYFMIFDTQSGGFKEVAELSEIFILSSPKVKQHIDKALTMNESIDTYRELIKMKALEILKNDK